MAKALKRVPYGQASFVGLRKFGYAFVDKTPFIQTLERGTQFPFLVRPRRFGKSVFANMLAAYYDKAAKADFEKNFAGTWIGEHPTPLASQYLVLQFDFSGIEPGEELVAGFISNVKTGLITFQSRYLGDDPRVEAVLNATYVSPARLLSDFLNLALKKLKPEEKIYLIIDEYDQFAQTVLSSDPGTFRAMAGKDGFLKAFYAVIKRFSTILIEWAFITGVTSISLDSMTSGFNIARNLTLNPAFSTMLGFTDSELRGLIPQLVDIERYGHSVDEIFDHMKVLYDGYRFSPDSEASVFNASMCLYYLGEIAETGHEPAVLLDPAFSVDLSKIEGVLSLGRKAFVEEVVADVLFDRSIESLGMSPAINLNAASGLSERDVLTALVCMGFLTFSSEDSGRLVCPNRAVKNLFFQYWFERIKPFDEMAFPIGSRKKAMASLAGGDIRPFLEFVGEALKGSVGLHVLAHLNETAIQLAAAMAVNTDAIYRVTAEEEALGAGYTDLILRPGKGHPEAAGWVIEFKYLKKSETTKSAVEAKLAEAVAQLGRYAKSENIAAIARCRLAAAAFSGTELKALKVL